MEILAGILSILQIAELAFNLKNHISKKEDADNIAQLFDNIGVLIEAVAQDLSNNNYPHSKCAEMSYLLSQFGTVLEKYSKQDVEKLQSCLQTAVQVERLFGELQTLTEQEKTKNISTLLSASGTFRAAATLAKL